MEPMIWRQNTTDVAFSKAPPHDYLVEHLATFSGVSNQGSLLSPEDGMRQLRQMALTQGHWVLRVHLLVKPSHLVIVDANSGEEMESIPIDFIRQPTAFMANTNKDLFNNVIIFTTVDGSNNTQGLTEMHIFQCFDQSAQVIIDDILAAKANRQQRENAAAYTRPKEDCPPLRSQEYEAAVQRTAIAFGAFNLGPSQAGNIRKSIQGTGNEAPQFSQHIVAGVDVLNHCFDDIEQFMEQLQKVADAYRDLEFRRKGRSKKDNFVGDGMMSLRARNPSQQAFTDIFQKFKFSFNLLARLKPYIHDPNAPELVHFLFTPLNLAVEATVDPRLGPGGLASSVISPLLTTEALELLGNCLTSKEIELHRKLGDAWNISRDEWRGYVPPYVPRFYNGWQAPTDWINDDAQPMMMNEQNVRPAEMQPSHYRMEGSTIQQHPRPTERLDPVAVDNRSYPVQVMPNTDPDARYRPAGPAPFPKPQKSNSCVANGEGGLREKDFLLELLSKNVTVYQVTQPRKSDKKKELTVEKGEIVEVLESDRQWWKIRNSKGETGYVPNTLLQPFQSQ